MGIGLESKRTIRDVSVTLSEAEAHGRQFFQSLQQRGLRGVELIVSDDHAGLKTACQAAFPSVPWQRCQFHRQQNAQASEPRQESSARRWPTPSAASSTAPAAPRGRTTAQRNPYALCPERAQTARLAGGKPAAGLHGVHAAGHQKRLRTANALERVHQKLKPRPRVARVFPNQPSLPRLISALLSEISDEWETGKIHLNMQTQNPPSV